MRKLLLAIALATAAGSALAQLPKDTEVPAGSLAPADATFIVAANRSNVAQMMLGRTAAAKAKDGGVRTLAEAVTSSHVKANDALKLLAAQKHVDLPGKPDADQQPEVDRLTAMRGADADRAYVDDVISDQDGLISIYQNAQDHSEDPDIRRYASIMLPSLQEHRRNASDLLARKPGA